MAGKRANKKTGNRAAHKAGLKTGGKGLYKAVKAIAKTEAEKIIETKYLTNLNTVTEGVGSANQPLVSNSLNSTFTLSGRTISQLQPVIPAISRGTQSDQIIGSRILLKSGKTDFTFHLRWDDAQSRNLVLKLFCLESRKVRDYEEMTLIPQDALLRIGNDTTTDFIPSYAAPLIMDLFPINKASFKVHHVKTFHFNKNCGNTNGQLNFPIAANYIAPNNGSVLHKFTWHWGNDKVLKYDDSPLHSGGGEYPTNFAPVWGVCAFTADGQPIGVNDGEYSSIQMSAYNHMYYKDA